MKAVKAILAIGLIIFLIVFFVVMVNQFLGVKKSEPVIKNLPKIKKELQQKADERADQINKASETEEGGKDNQE